MKRFSLFQRDLNECAVPDRLRRWQWVNLFEPKGYGKLLNAMRQRAGAVPLRLWTEAPQWDRACAREGPRREV